MRAFAALLVMLTFGLPSPTAESTARRSVVIQGTVRDASTKLPIEGAIIAASSLRQSVVSDRAGRYVLRLVVDDSVRAVRLQATRIGYAPSGSMIQLPKDSVVADFALAQQLVALEQVVVSGSRAKVSMPAAALPTTNGVVAGVSRRPSYAKLEARRRSLERPAMDSIAHNTEEYGRIHDNDFVSVDAVPLSTFSVDVDRASYTNVRRFINDGQMPPKDAVRIEELVNYFPYSYAEPTGSDPVAISSAVAPAPWNPSHRIVRVGLQTKHIATEKLPPSNLVFLVDVSGSMNEPRKLPLVKQALRLLVNELREQDRVAMVVYAGSAGLVLPSTPAWKKDVILDAIERLEAGGSTAGGAGIRLAYEVAKQNLRRDGNNRVILATDGDFNVGISNTADLVRFVEERRADGIYLTVLGFGMGNLKDARLEQLADKGNGNYAYIDDLLEAKKTFVHEMGATLVTVAKDVKLQIEFNPSEVQAYRLIGYENRLLRAEEFDDDRKDAGEMGAGHSVTALYEVVPSGVKLDVQVQSTSAKRYQRSPSLSHESMSGEMLFVNVRYKRPADSTSKLMQVAVRDRDATASEDFRFALAVAGYGMLLRESPHKGRWTYDEVMAQASSAIGEDPNHYRREFVSLVKKTKELAGRVATRKP